MRAVAVLSLLTALAPAAVAGGDIQAQVVKKSLRVTGSAGNDVIRFDQAGVGGKQIRVTPLVASTLNGSNAAIVFSGVTKDVVLESGAGADTVLVDHVAFRRDFRMTTGSGNVTLTLVACATKRDLRVTTPGSGQTHFFVIGDLDVGRNLRLLLGDGSNLMTGTDHHLKFHGGRLLCIGGAGTDTLFVGLISGLKKPSKFDLGDGVNSLTGLEVKSKGRLRMRTGSGQDLVSLPARVGGDLVIDVGDGNNQVGIQGSKVKGKTKVTGGADTDTMLADASKFTGAARFRLGDGANTLSTGAGIKFQSLRVTGGDDKDILSANGLVAKGDVKVVFGEGNNQVMLANAAIKGDLRVTTGDGDDSLDLTNATISGTTKFKSGAGNDTGP